MRKISILILSAFVLHVSSCNLLLAPGEQTVNITTTNENSVVFENKYEIGRGGSNSLKVKKKGAEQIIVQTPGYKDEYIVMLPYKKHKLFYPYLILDFPSVIGLCFSTINKTFDYLPDWHLENKYKLDKRLETEKYIDLLAIKLNINDKNKDIQDYFIESKGDIYEMIDKAVLENKIINEKLEKKNNKKAPKQNKLINSKLNENQIKSNDTEFSKNIYKLLKKTEFIDTVNNVFQDNNNTIVLEAEIRKVDKFKINRKGAAYSSGLIKAGMGIQWYIKNTYDEILDSVYIYEYSGDFCANDLEEKDDIFFYDAVENSYLKLRESKEFQNNIILNTDFSSKDEKMSIIEPKKVVKEVADASLASVIIKRNDKGHGSGFAISNDGYILTNFHVIAGKTTGKLEGIKVILSNGEELEAKVVRYNRSRDIALLKVDYQFEKAFVLNSIKDIKNLQEVYTIGTPKSVELGQTVTKGLISNERNKNNNSVLQLSISLNGGNSGGPLFDKTGVLYGVIQSKLVGYATEGVGFAIPSYLIAEYLNIFITK
ncbi:MAG: trypsin-like peptidase domain-containing protein [Fluviicola sp.]|nr:trypsin-like peptidase domain-containing protein [Fluviicola sp.]